MKTPNPTTFVVGAGPVATALAGALRLSGVPVLGLWARKPAAGGLRGLEALSGFPSNVGGAVFMNAGCYGTEIKDVPAARQTVSRCL